MDQVEKELAELVVSERAAYEMAQLDTTFSNESLEIWIYAGEGNVPHFHFKNDSKRIEGCIRLDRAEYFPHGNKKSKLNSIQRKDLVKLLSSPSNDLPSITNWQLIVILWNANNRKYPVSSDLAMPNYQELK